MPFAPLSRLSLLTLHLAILTLHLTIKLIALFLLFLNIPTAEIGLITNLDILVGERLFVALLIVSLLLMIVLLLDFTLP